ncbi:MAG: MCE family protein [Streptosporangiales bacterium]
MIGRTVKIQLIAFLVITCLGLSYVSANYVGLTDYLLDKQYTVSVDLAKTGGLFKNAEVTYRGVTVGQVGRMRITRTGVRVDLELDKGVMVPADATAVVADRSAVGEQYLDLQPHRRSGPYLHDGSVIPRSRTHLPVSSTQLLVDLDQLVNSVPKKDLVTVITELDKAFSGTGPALQSLIDNGNALTKAATANLDPTTDLLENGRTVLDTQLETQDAIRTFAKHLASLSEQLKTSDPDLRKVLENGTSAAPQVTSLLRSLDPSLGVLLGNLVTVGGVQAVRLPGLRQILITYPDVVAGGLTVTADGTSHVGLVVDLAPVPCTRGYESTAKRYPQETADIPANDHAYCAEPPSSTTDVRGVQNAPGPTGEAPTDPGPSGDWSGRSAYGGGYRYDAATGRVTGPGGGPVTMGSTGGHRRMFGDDSWKMLLLGPLGR